MLSLWLLHPIFSQHCSPVLSELSDAVCMLNQLHGVISSKAVTTSLALPCLRSLLPTDEAQLVGKTQKGGTIIVKVRFTSWACFLLINAWSQLKAWSIMLTQLALSSCCYLACLCVCSVPECSRSRGYCLQSSVAE